MKSSMSLSGPDDERMTHYSNVIDHLDDLPIGGDWVTIEKRHRCLNQQKGHHDPHASKSSSAREISRCRDDDRMYFVPIGQENWVTRGRQRRKEEKENDRELREEAHRLGKFWRV